MRPKVPVRVNVGDLVSITVGGNTVRVRVQTVSTNPGPEGEPLLHIGGAIAMGTLEGAAYEWDERFGGTFFIVESVRRKG